MLRNSSTQVRSRSSVTHAHSIAEQPVREEEFPRTASPDFIEQDDEINFDHYKLPPAVEVAMNSWIENSNSMAVIMTLFAAVQIILIQILPSFRPSSSANSAGDAINATDSGGAGNSSATSASPLWKATSFFMYCGIFLHLGGAISAVVIMLFTSTLPIQGRHIALTDTDSLAHKVFVSRALYKADKKRNNKSKKINHDKDENEQNGDWDDYDDDNDYHNHDDDDNDHENSYKPVQIPLDLLRDENALLAEWGLGRKFQIAGIHMSICFVLGFLASFLSVMLWVWSWEPSSYATKIGGALIPILLAAGLTFCFVLTG